MTLPTIPSSATTYGSLAPEQQATIEEAIGILESTLKAGDTFGSAAETKQFCRLKLGTARDECFCCLFLDNQHRLLQFERLFHGSIASATVHPRVVVRRALELNAAAVVLTHNHPSGIMEPSNADNAITSRLIHALGLIDVRVLDHVIVSAEGELSMAEKGLL